MKRIMVVLGVLILTGCVDSGEDGLLIEKTNNDEFEVTLLFEHDSCKVYRFIDGYRPRYFVRCKSEEASTEWSDSHQSGKVSVTIDESIPTTNH